MKRTIIFLTAIGLALGMHAQNTTDADSLRTADSLWWDAQPRIALWLGLQGGATLYSNTYDDSPYYSTHGLFMQVPLLFSCRVSPRWQLAAGLRYDLCFDPLHYPVKLNEVGTPPEYTYVNGLDFEDSPVGGKQFAFALHNYIGIPLQATWYPYPRERNLLSVGFDLYAGYAFANLVSISHRSVSRTGSGSVVNISDNSGWDVDLPSDDPTVLRWRMELGVTLSTNVLGLVHGVRFFGSLLPTYRDPLTGDEIYNFGMSIYL